MHCVPPRRSRVAKIGAGAARLLRRPVSMNHEWKRPAPGLEALNPLVGKWHTEGQRYAGPFGPASPFVAVETFEWLDGGQFLIHRLEGKFGRMASACVEIFGRDAQGLFAQTFYNDGRATTWRVIGIHDGVVLSGTWSTGADGTFQVRYTARVIEEGNTIAGTWEHSREGAGWQPFLELRSTKAQALPNASVGY